MATSSTSNSNGPSRWWWAGGAALLVLLLIPTFQPGGGILHLRYQRKVLGRGWRESPVLILGDSRTESGVNPALLAEAFGEGPAFNAGIPSLSVAGLAGLLEQFPPGARYLFVGLSPPMLHAHNRKMTDGWTGFSSGLDIPASLARWTAARASWELRLGKPFFFLDRERLSIRPEEGLRNFARRLWQHPDPIAPDALYRYDDTSGYLPYLRVDPSIAAHGLELNAHRYEGAPDKAGFLRLIGLLRRCQDKGTHVFLLRLPTNEEFRRYERTHSPFDDLVAGTLPNGPLPWLDLQENGDGLPLEFYDGHHLAGESADRVTARIGRWARRVREKLRVERERP